MNQLLLLLTCQQDLQMQTWKINNQETADEEYTSFMQTWQFKKESKHSILCKIISEKLIHMNSIQSALTNVWCNPPGLKIREIEGKFFQFFMDDKFDWERILQGNP